MLKDWASSIFVGLVSAFLVTAIIQQMWDVGWERAAVVGVVFFFVGIVLSQAFQRTIQSQADWVTESSQIDEATPEQK